MLLLEAGGKDNWIWIHIPVGYLYTQNNPRTDWCFQTEPEPGLNGRALNYPRGRVLGGCSSINGMIYMRGQARDYDQLAPAGQPRLGLGRRPAATSSSPRTMSRGADEMHGAGGEWRVEQQRLSWEILDAFRDAAAEVGIPKIADFNRGDNEGCGYFQVNQRRGVRWSTAKAFLRPAQAPAEPHGADGRRRRRGIAFDGQTRGRACAFVQDGRREPRAGGAARCSWRAARSARRSCCSSRASGPAALLAGARHPGACMSWTASAPTSRTTCSSAWSTRSRTPAR